MHVLILGARAPACLEWARAFRHVGWQVTVADSLGWTVARSSRAAHRFVRLPEPRFDTEAWLDALIQCVLENRVDVVLPTCEEAFYLAHGRDRLTPLCRVMTSDFDTMHRLHHKGRFAQWTQAWNVRAPETHMLSVLADLDAYRHDPSAWVFKPAYSRFAHQTLIRPAPSALAAIRPTQPRPWLAQRFIAGREHCSFSLLVDGRLTAHATYHPRYRVGRGSGIYFEPTDLSSIREFLIQFGTATGYTGQVGFDFIEDAEGQVHVLECNPRGTSGVHLFDDQPEALVHALLGTGKVDEVIQPSMHPRMVALAMLLFAAPRFAFDRHFWRDFGAARDVIIRPGDSGPLLAQVPALLEISGRALRRRCGLLAAATSDIEWDGQAL